MALDVSAGNPKSRTIDGAYVSNARCGPLLMSEMPTCTKIRQLVNWAQHCSNWAVQDDATHGTLEGRELEVLLLLALHGVVHQHPRSENVQLALGEHSTLWQEGRRRLAERVGEEEAEDESAHDSEYALGSGYDEVWCGD